MGIRGDMRKLIQSINVHSTPRRGNLDAIFSIAESFGMPQPRPARLGGAPEGCWGGGGEVLVTLKKTAKNSLVICIIVLYVLFKV